jgi:hypothetical protein
MRWFFAGVIASVLALISGGVAKACGCCGCCQGGGGCPNCPCRPNGPGEPTCPHCPGGSNRLDCPNCARQFASAAPSPYWSGAYGCYLYYDPASRCSYYWSETNRSYFPVQDDSGGAAVTPGGEAISRSGPTITTTLYYSPDWISDAARSPYPGR